MNATNQMQANQMATMPAQMNNMGMNMQQMQGQNGQMPSQMFNNPQAMMGMMANNGQGQFQQQQQNMMNNQMSMNQGGFPTPTQKQREELNQKYKTERCRHYETHKNCLLKEKCHFAHGDEDLRKPGDPFTPEQLILAQKSIQYQNCNQTPGKPQQHNQNYRGGRKPQTMRGSFRGNGQFGGRGGNGMSGGRGNFQNYRGGSNGGNGGGQYNSNGSNGQNGGGMNRMNQNQNYQPQNGRNPRDSNSNDQQQQQQQQQIPNPTPGPNYKTVKCRHFEKRGHCKFGDKCSYAHGDQELRTSQSTPTGSKMRQNSGGMNNQMPAPMGMEGMQNMNQFPGMMMQNQMGFPGQSMYNIDPNMNMQMMFNPQGSGNDPQNQQFGMMPNQFMQMQNQLMGMQLQQQQQQQQNYNMQPTVINFKKLENMPDGTQQQVNNTLSINQMEQTLEANKQIQDVCGLINNGDNDQAFMMLTKLKEQGKIQFQINKNAPMQNQVENAEQNPAMIHHEQKK